MMVYKDFNDPGNSKEPLSLYVIMFQSGEIMDDKVKSLLNGFGKQYMKVDSNSRLAEETVMVHNQASDTKKLLGLTKKQY